MIAPTKNLIRARLCTRNSTGVRMVLTTMVLMSTLILETNMQGQVVYEDLYRGEVPDYTQQVPDYSQQVPDYTQQVPDYTQQVPNYSQPDGDTSINSDLE